MVRFCILSVLFLIMPASPSSRHHGIFDVLHTDGARTFFFFLPPQLLTILQTSDGFFNMPVNHLPEACTLGIDPGDDESNDCH